MVRRNPCAVVKGRASVAIAQVVLHDNELAA